MVSYRAIDFKELSTALEALLPYPLAARIRARRHVDRLLGIEALVDGQSIGCLVIDYFDILNKGKTLAWIVEEAHRRQGIGAELFHQLKKLLPDSHKTILELFFPSNPITEHMIKKLGWSNPVLYLERYTFDGFRFSPRWLKKYPARLPKGMKFIPWNALTPTMLYALMRQEKQRTFEISVSPFGEEEILEPINSLALVLEGTVIGWCVTHRVDAQTIQYSALYIAKEWRFKGAAMILLVMSILKQQQSPIQWAVLEVNIHEVDRSWHKFVKVRLAPYADKFDNVLASAVVV